MPTLEVQQQQVKSDILTQVRTAKAEVHRIAGEALKEEPRDVEVGPAIGILRGERIKEEVAGWKREELGKIEAAKRGALGELEKSYQEAKAAPVEWDLSALTEEQKKIFQDYGIEELERRARIAGQLEYETAIKGAEEDWKKTHVLVAGNQWIDKEEYEALSAEDKKLIQSRGVKGFNTAKQADYDKAVKEYEIAVAGQALWIAEHVEIKPDEWVPKAEWEGLTPSQQTEVIATGQYTIEALPSTERLGFEELTELLGREPSLAEVQAYATEPAPWEGIPVLGSVLSTISGIGEWMLTQPAMLIPGLWTGYEALGIVTPEYKEAVEEYRKVQLADIPWWGDPWIKHVTALEPWAPFLRSAYPGVAYKDISKMEWISGFINIGLLGAPIVIPPAIRGFRFAAFKIPGPILKLKSPITGLSRVVRTPVTIKPIVPMMGQTVIARPQFRFPVSVSELGLQLPVKVGWGAGLKRLGLPKSLSHAAKVSGAAAKELQAATKAFKGVTSPKYVTEVKGAGIVASPEYTAAASRLAQAQARARWADTRFLDALSPYQLTRARSLALERVTGYKGVTGALEGLGTRQVALEKAWLQLEKFKFGTKSYYKGLSKLTEAQVGVDTAALRVSKILKPRYAEAPSTAWTRAISEAEGRVSRALAEVGRAEEAVGKWASQKNRVHLENVTAELRVLETELANLKTAQAAGEWAPLSRGMERGPTPTEEHIAKYDSIQERLRIWEATKRGEAVGKLEPMPIPEQASLFAPSRLTRAIGPAEAGLTEAEWVRFLAARTGGLKVGPKVWRGMEAAAGGTLRPGLPSISQYIQPLWTPYGIVQPTTWGVSSALEGLVIPTMGAVSALVTPEAKVMTADQVSALGLSQSQVAGTFPMTTSQTEAIAATTGLTRIQIQEMVRTGTLSQVVPYPMEEVTAKPATQFLTVPAFQYMVEPAPAFALAPAAAFEVAPITEVAPATAVTTAVTTRVAERVPGRALPPIIPWLPGAKGDGEEFRKWWEEKYGGVMALPGVMPGLMLHMPEPLGEVIEPFRPRPVIRKRKTVLVRERRIPVAGFKAVR